MSTLMPSTHDYDGEVGVEGDGEWGAVDTPIYFV